MEPPPSLPVAMGHRRPTALTARRPAIAPGHLGRGPGLVDEDELLGVETGLGVDPELAAGNDIRPLLLGGVRGFF